MNMQQMIQTMNKVQKQFEKEKNIHDAKEFEFTANGAVKVILKGDYSLVSVTFVDPDILKDDPEMVQDMIKIAYDGAKKIVDDAFEKLTEKFSQNAKGGFPF